MRKRLFLISADVIFLSISFCLSFYWFHLNPRWFWNFYTLYLLSHFLVFTRFGLYQAILRFAGFPLAASIIKATTLTSILYTLFIFAVYDHNISPGFFATGYLLTNFLVAFSRFSPRYFFERQRVKGTNRILIYGAGELGEEAARKLRRNPGEYNLIGFIDDKPSKIGNKLHNLPIYGPTSQLSAILNKHQISEVIIAIAALGGEDVLKITRECRKSNVICRIVPNFNDMLKKDIDIKDIDISDLLRREPKDLDKLQISHFIKGKTILITGAGGSIGTELSRQCVRYDAKRLVLVDSSEYNLYSLREELSSSQTEIRFCLANVSNNGSLENIIREELPHIFLHAAAYKHVPIVEENPFEGVLNNVGSTINTAELADKYGVEKYVLISTDKAVRPTNVMGASKRIAELYIQNFNPKSKTEFIGVRFGNVLGSSGSVIPKFLEQIKQGGPVTVTHPEITRYFMLVNEAVQLVLQAASIGNGGNLFILNMGKPVKIAEMAEDLIFLSGRKPHQDIKIEFTGLRAGEKLYEELLIDDAEKKTQYENILIARPSFYPWDRLRNQIEALLDVVKKQDRIDTLKMLKMIVPEFNHAELNEIQAEQKVIPLHRVNAV